MREWGSGGGAGGAAGVQGRVTRAYSLSVRAVRRLEEGVGKHGPKPAGCQRTSFSCFLVLAFFTEDYDRGGFNNVTSN